MNDRVIIEVEVDLYREDKTHVLKTLLEALTKCKIVKNISRIEYINDEEQL